MWAFLCYNATDFLLLDHDLLLYNFSFMKDNFHKIFIKRNNETDYNFN